MEGGVFILDYISDRHLKGFILSYFFSPVTGQTRHAFSATFFQCTERILGPAFVSYNQHSGSSRMHSAHVTKVPRIYLAVSTVFTAPQMLQHGRLEPARKRTTFRVIRDGDSYNEEIRSKFGNCPDNVGELAGMSVAHLRIKLR